LTELLYILTINERLTPSLWRPWRKTKIERGLGLRFALTLGEWQFQLGKLAFNNPGEGPDINLDQTKVDERIKDFSNALLAGLTPSEVARIRKIEAKWRAQKDRELSSAVARIPQPYYPERQKGRSSEGPFLMTIGGMLSPIGLLSIVQTAAGYAPGNVGYLGLGGLVLAAIGYAINMDATHEVRAQFAHDKKVYEHHLAVYRTTVTDAREQHAAHTTRLGAFFDHTLQRPTASKCAAVLTGSTSSVP
jgi:hypothetical protein